METDCKQPVDRQQYFFKTVKYDVDKSSRFYNDSEEEKSRVISHFGNWYSVPFQQYKTQIEWRMLCCGV